MKSYKLGITIGRFQTFHKGHQVMIDKAIELCEKVGVFIGSSQESGTNKNPFSYEMRESILKKIYGDRISIYPLFVFKDRVQNGEITFLTVWLNALENHRIC